jgi:hypothetical protein
MKHNNFTVIFLLSTLVLVILTACAPSYYVARDFSSKTSKHKIVAVIPVEIVLTGTRPKKITEAQQDSLVLVESEKVQMTLFDNLLRYANVPRRPVRVDFQDVARTNKALADSGIKIKDACVADPIKLAKILKVDAVIVTRIERKHYMGDLASYGVQVVTNAVQSFTNYLPGVNQLGGSPAQGKTNDVRATCTLLNGEDGAILWKDRGGASSDWNSPLEGVYNNLTTKFSRNFPYRR